MLPPIWLRDPSRFAGLARSRAIVALVLIAMLLLWSLTAIDGRAATASHSGMAAPSASETDLMLYDGIVDELRHGGDYYSVAATALRAGHYPLRPFLAFRLPTLAVVEAWLPTVVTIDLLYALVIGVGLVWFDRLRQAMASRWPLAIALLLLATGMMAFVQPGLIAFHEIWAGLLVALSLGLRRSDRWIEAVAVALMAMLVRETAALYVGVMGMFALLEGRRTETIGWVVVGAHAHAVAQVWQPHDPLSPGWSGQLGFGFFVRAVVTSTGLDLLPAPVAAPLAALALFGWAAWRDPLASRALATFVLYALLIGIAGRPDTFYWALVIAPTILVGLVFVPDAVRDLAASALDKRRITVTRLSR